MNKKILKIEPRLRRAKRSRMKMSELGVIRLSVYRTPRHIYAQVLDARTANVLASASTLDKEIRGKLRSTGNVSAAELVGKLIAKRANDAGIQSVAFDRSGFKYHGRIKALAESARENGLQF